MDAKKVKLIVSELLQDDSTRPLFAFVCLNTLVLVFEIVYGMSINSLGLVCDGVHMIVSCSGLTISLFAMKFAQKEQPTLQFSYGYDRFEVLAAFSNATFLVFVSMFLVAEGLHRFSEPVNIHTNHIVKVALVGLAVNLSGYAILSQMRSKLGVRMDTPHKRGGGPVARDANIQSLLLHTLGDIASTVGVLISTLLVRWKGWAAADPTVAIFISGLIIVSVVPLLRSTGRVLLQASPADGRPMINKVLREVSALEGVIECERENFWSNSPGLVVGTLKVKIRTDADKDSILVAIHRAFAPFVAHLAVEVERTQPIDWWKGSNAPHAGVSSGPVPAVHAHPPPPLAVQRSPRGNVGQPPVNGGISNNML